jgi:hypothetical protein
VLPSVGQIDFEVTGAAPFQIKLLVAGPSFVDTFLTQHTWLAFGNLKLEMPQAVKQALQCLFMWPTLV